MDEGTAEPPGRSFTAEYAEVGPEDGFFPVKCLKYAERRTASPSLRVMTPFLMAEKTRYEDTGRTWKMNLRCCIYFIQYNPDFSLCPGWLVIGKYALTLALSPRRGVDTFCSRKPALTLPSPPGEGTPKLQGQSIPLSWGRGQG